MAVSKGGPRKITGALTSYLRSLGGEVYTGVRVGSVEEVPRTRTVVFDVTPRQLLEIAGAHFTERYRRALGRWRYGPGVFKVDSYSTPPEGSTPARPPRRPAEACTACVAPSQPAPAGPQLR